MNLQQSLQIRYLWQLTPGIATRPAVINHQFTTQHENHT